MRSLPSVSVPVASKLMAWIFEACSSETACLNSTPRLAARPVATMTATRAILLDFEGYEDVAVGPVVFPVFTILLSVILGWLRQRTGSIWAGCLAHAAANTTGGSLTVYLFLRWRPLAIDQLRGRAGVRRHSPGGPLPSRRQAAVGAVVGCEVLPVCRSHGKPTEVISADGREAARCAPATLTV
jgi:hypothetical protein